MKTLVLELGAAVEDCQRLAESLAAERVDPRVAAQELARQQLALARLMYVLASHCAAREPS